MSPETESVPALWFGSACGAVRGTDPTSLSPPPNPVTMDRPAGALKEVTGMAAQLQSSLIRLENFQKLTELQRDLIGMESLITPGRVSEGARPGLRTAVRVRE